MASLRDTVWTEINDGWWGGHACGYGYGGIGYAASVVPIPEPAPAKPATDEPERTGMQGATGSLWGPWGILRSSFSTYRQLMRIPSVALVRSEVAGSILSGSWTIETDDDASGTDGAKAMLEAAIIPQRTQILRHALKALDFGFSAFEPVWGVVDAERVITRYKPLRWERTSILVGETHGEVAGVRQEQVDLTGPYYWLYSYDAEPGDPRGRSRLENVREAGSKWLEVQTRIGRLIDKESGAVIAVTHPPGGGRDASGVAASNRDIARAMAQSAAQGSAWLAVENPLGALTPEQRRLATPDQIVELLKTKLWGIENIPLGGNGPALTAMMLYSQYLDAQMIRAYLRPERSLIEGNHGTKAEAGVHSDTGTTDSERIEADIVESLNAGPVAAMLTDNYPALVGKVRVVAQPLRDLQEGIDKELLLAIASGTATADEFYRTFDVPAIADRRGVQLRKVPLPPPEPPPAPPGANGKPVNGNGRMNGKGNLAAAMRGLFEDDEE